MGQFKNKKILTSIEGEIDLKTVELNRLTNPEDTFPKLIKQKQTCN